MDRRELLTVTGATLFASLAGCVGDTFPNDDDSADDGAFQSDHLNPPEKQPNLPDEVLAELAHGNAEFATDLYGKLAQTDDDNLFLSPYSITTALAMTYAGADGQTRDEMEATLHFTLEDKTHEAFADLAHELATREEIEDETQDEPVDAFTLRVANALWGRTGYGFADEFLHRLDSYYGSGLIEADFAGQPDAERERINDWIATATEDNIEELLPAGSISADTVFVITNAIYFMASWLEEFDPDETMDEPFTPLAGDEQTVPMMHQQLEAPYLSRDTFKAIEMPYVGTEVSMVLILPDEGTFAEFEASLDADQLFGIFDSLEMGTGGLALPQFEIESTVELADVLTEMGMQTAFGDGEADFSRMVDGEGGLWIDQVYHDAFVSVDEEGTEAAAATAVVGDDSLPPDWGELRFDRPFIFCIRDRPTDAVMFLGRVTDVGEAQ